MGGGIYFVTLGIYFPTVSDNANGYRLLILVSERETLRVSVNDYKVDTRIECRHFTFFLVCVDVLCSITVRRYKRFL